MLCGYLSIKSAKELKQLKLGIQYCHSLVNLAMADGTYRRTIIYGSRSLRIKTFLFSVEDKNEETKSRKII